MGKTLVVAEKPSVARDIARALGVKADGAGGLANEEWVVSWALGHLVALCDPDEVDEKWKHWRMESLPMLPQTLPTKVLPKTKAQFLTLKRLMNDKSVEKIICATDSGREGELIFRLIYAQAGCRKPVSRLWISSMTDAAIREGFRALKPDSAYDALYESAKCRSEADWLVGMNASRAFTLRYDALLSVGRVQTPTLALLVARDREIRAFVPKDYWEVRANFGDYEGLYLNPATGDARVFEQDAAMRVKKAVTGKQAEVIESVRERKHMPPPQLYDLTSLQREANKLLGLSAAKTLELAQSLYERRKLITYPRTDSRYLPRDMRGKVEGALRGMTGELGALAKAAIERGLPFPARVYDDAKLSDHHAIVPTGAKTDLAKLPEAEAKLYDMIARRLVAAHYPDYEYESARVLTRCEGHDFRSAGATPLVEGWRACYPKPDKADATLPKLEVGDKRSVAACSVKKCKTQPPERHTDASLLQAMESAGRALTDETLRDSMKDSGLGTPATRAAILERLIEVGYAKRRGKVIESTEKGDRLVSAVPEPIASPVTTGKWEKALSAMAKCPSPEETRALSERFMQGIRRYAAYLVEAAKNAPEVGITPEPKRGAPKRKAAASKKLALPCPACGQGEITENSRAFGCSRWKQGCGFTVWKMSREAPDAPALDAASLKTLLSGGTAEVGGYHVRYQNGKVLYQK